MKEEKEGKFLSHGEKEAPASEGVFNGGEDNQIASIEEQLKKTQDTLESLQILKKQLEEDRKKKDTQAKQESERLDAEKILQENSKLKDELKNYQGEINSLKGIIASLKDDLVTSTEQLQIKVANSLKILEEADASLKTNTLNTNTATNPLPNKTDDNDGNKKISENTDQTNKDNPQNDEKIDDKKEKTETTSNEGIKESNDPTPGENAVASGKGRQSIHPETKNSVGPSETENNPEIEAVAKLEVKPTKEKTTDEQDDTLSIEDELVEYEKIRKELNAMEDGNYPSEEKLENEGPIKLDDEPTEKQTEAKTRINNIDDKPDDKPKEEDNTVVDKSGKIPVKVTVSTKDPEEKAEEKIETSQEPTQDKQELTSEKKIDNNNPKPKIKKKFLFFKKKEKTRDEVIGTEPPKEDVNEKPTEKKKTRRLLFFKRKDKKEENPKKKDEHKPNADTTTGGLFIKTAVLFMVLFTGGVVYQLINAEKLRTVYVDQVKGRVKGATDTNPTRDPSAPKQFQSASIEQKYKEAYADVPLAETNWVSYNDPNLGIQIDYPKNTSYKYLPADMKTVWFLRKNGYLVKIEKDTSGIGLNQYYANLKTEINYKIENIEFKGFPTIHLIQYEYLEVRGDIYLVKAGNDIYKIWYKTFNPGENIDDEQRVQRMLSSLKFLDAKPITNTKKTKK